MVDYLKEPLIFKIKKLLRYIRLYGPYRTYVKGLGQYHMKKHFDPLPPFKKEYSSRQNIAIIGCGNYGFTNIAFFLKNCFGSVIAACMDADIHRAASLAQRYKVPFYTVNADEIIEDPNISLVYIASNHSSHAEYAIAALDKGKSVYIEKPHVVNEDQLLRLCKTMEKSQGKVFLGFNRPGSRFGQIIQKTLDNEKGPGMYNWFIAGHAIDPDHWYFKPEEGGRVLGNLCHWTDFTLRLVKEKTYPIKITPTRDVKSDCDIAVTYAFGDGTIAAITFSAKGHTFEGVKERFSGHKGNCLLTMDDFEHMTIEIIENKRIYRNFYRDHGHRSNIVKAYQNVIYNESYDREWWLSHIWNTGWLFLKTREALERNEIIFIDSFRECVKEMN
ncbi:MAG: Gfo/Idh/MocA family protein [Candidatus Xenobiia bacterium LiM19]